MARASSIPFDDIAKAIAKAAKAAKGAPKKGPRKPPPAGGAKVKPKPKPKKPAGGTSAKAPVTKQQREVARREKFESMPRAGKIAKVPPAYPPKRGNVSGKRAVATTEADKREATRQANRLLRMAGETPKPRQTQSAKKSIDTSGSVPKTSKRSKSQPMGPTSSYEADIMRRLRAADARRFK